MQCPSCQSENIQKFSVIYEQGTSDSTTSGSIVGNTNSGGYSNVEYVNTHTTVVTKMAQKAAPPTTKRYAGPAIILFIGVTMLVTAWQNVNLLLIGLCLIGLGGLYIYRAYTYNVNKYPVLYATWDKMWNCNRCGQVFKM